MSDKVNDGSMYPKLIFFTDEAWFYLNDHVSSKSNRYYSAENPDIVNERPLHDQKVGVWCAVNADRIIGPIFFEETINGQRYRDVIIRPFLEYLCDIECTKAYFQQDSATAHTADLSLQLIREIFEDRVISKGLWPPRSPDLTVCDIYLLGNLKNKCIRTTRIRWKN